MNCSYAPSIAAFILAASCAHHTNGEQPANYVAGDLITLDDNGA
jgi:hypothetical protein